MPVLARFRRRGLGRLLIALVALLVFIGAAKSLLKPARIYTHGRTVSSMFEDDSLLLLQPNDRAGDNTVESTVQKLKSLGVDRLRLLVQWQYIALQKQRPADAANPAAYAACWWAPYDRIVRDAKAAGLGVDFDISGKAPSWATGTGAPAGVEAGVWEPSDTAFEQFVQAVGKRYDGSYTPSSQCGGETVADTSTLPRVSFWSVWNEPNQQGWLSPQYRQVGGSWQPASPGLYRGLVDAYWKALAATGHTPRRDTILVGELAPSGCLLTGNGSCAGFGSNIAEWPMPPIPFLQALYCVNTNDQPLTGSAATAVGCPASGSTSAFVSANPALFEMTGFAHHPYNFLESPSAPVPQLAFAPLSELSRLETALDDALAAYGAVRKPPLYLTEYGYVTNPPNPHYTISPAQQAAYLNQAEYLAYADPRVRALSQYELRDAPPNTQYPSSSPKYWESFQSGLEYINGQPKPALVAYQLPIWIPRSTLTTGASTLVWGMLRAADNDTKQTARIEWAAAGSAVYRTLATVTTTDPDGFLEKKVTPPATGTIRLAWTNASGQVRYSRSAAVTVGS